MAKEKANKKEKRVRIGSTKITALFNDGINTPVPDTRPTAVPSESEAALIKQADNPLGDPNKI